MEARGVGYRALLERPPFRSLWAAGGLTMAVIPVLLVVLVWTVTQAFPGVSSGSRGTGVALSLSLLGLSATVPTLLGAVVAGTLADIFPRLRLMQGVNLLEIAGVVGMMFVLVARPSAPVVVPFVSTPLPMYLVLLFPLWATVSTAATLFRPALNASIPRVATAAELGTANSALYAFGLSVSVVGSLAVPILLVTSGPLSALSVPLAFLLAAQLFLLWVDSPLDPDPRPPRRVFLKEVTEGYRFLRQRTALLQITLAALAINFLSAIAFVELGLYVTLNLGIQHPVYLGALYAGASVGAAVGTLAMSRIRFEHRAGRFLALLALLQGLLVLGLVVIRWYPAALIDMFLYGVIPGMYTVAFIALLQATVRNDMLGRVLSADEVGSYSLVPIGQYVGGTLTLLFGVSSTFLIGGLGIVMTGVLMLLLADLRSLGFHPAGGVAGPPPGALLEGPLPEPLL